MKFFCLPNFLLSFCLLLPFGLSAQSAPDDSVFTRLEMRIDTANFSLENDLLTINGRDYLRFEYQQESIVAELLMFPYSPYSVRSLKLLPSPDYQPYDSLIKVGRTYFRCRVSLENLSEASSLQIPVQMIRYNGDTANTVISLFHTATTEVTVPPGGQTLYIGEEAIIPLETPLPKDIRPQPNWVRLPEVAYRITFQDQRPQLHLLPLKYGNYELTLPIDTKRPSLDENGRLTYQSIIQPFEIVVKRGKVQFLSLDKDQVFLPKGERYAEIDVRFPRQFTLSLGKPYRLERAERGVSPLVAEMLVREMKADEQMLATLRVYDYHRRSDGPLYLKAQDEVLFLTNLDVLPPPKALKVEVRRRGKDWSEDLSLKPGDEFDLRVTGQSLGQAVFTLKDLPGVGDPVIKEQGMVLSWNELQIPLNISQRELALTRNGERTGYALTIKEYQVPRNLDFVIVKVSNDSSVLTKLQPTLILPQGEKDLQISFRRDSIDQGDDLHGLQYLDVIYEVWDKENRMLAKRRTRQVVICPGKSSPRHAAYDRSECFDGTLSLNDLMDTPLYELPGWAQVRVTIAHQADKYQQEVRRIPFTVVLKKTIELGLEFSTPVGVIMNRFGSGQNETLNTLNFAAMLQIGLYQDGAINQLQPIQLGVGLMAVDVFPFNGESERDLMLGSFLTFYPIDSKQRWNVPLYLGGGYLLGRGSGFFFLGPGLSVRL